jgi:hypothetical protein
VANGPEESASNAFRASSCWAAIHSSSVEFIAANQNCRLGCVEDTNVVKIVDVVCVDEVIRGLTKLLELVDVFARNATNLLTEAFVCLDTKFGSQGSDLNDDSPMINIHSIWPHFSR